MEDKAEKILDALRGRRGFDILDDLDDDIIEEIKEEINEIIATSSSYN